ncbi:MAG: M20/M25/M40 family metallo-hydrolase [Actinobacteria bacterium]|nr:M20/M25/M40 family metallo-hydrolase [Actinomycetota bacterium]
MAEDIVQLLQRLIAIDSVNSHLGGKANAEFALHVFLESWAKSAGFITTRLPIGSQSEGPNFNLLITYEVSEHAPWLLFESHSDTVGIDGMKIDPFASLISEGKLHGRGACDTKGSGAAMLCALVEYTALHSHSQNIAVLFVTEEEISKSGVNAFVTKQLPGLSWVPRGVIVGEPTNCELVVAHNGVIRWKVAVKGLAAHSSNPSLGKSAISKMAKLLLVFEKQYCEKLDLVHPLTGRAACSVNVISGGDSVNIIPAHCEVTIDRRVLPGEISSQIIRDYSKVINDIAARDGDMEVEIQLAFIDRALDPLTNRELASKVSEVLDSLGFHSAERGVGYGTDASTYSYANIPAIVLGPGSIEQAHTSDEWVDISELHKAQAIYLELMRMKF